MVDVELSRAVLVYERVGSSSYPRSDRAGVRQEFGDRAEALLARLDELTREVNGVAIDWSTTSQDDAIERVRAMLIRDHPELGHEAVEALVWGYSFGIK